MQLQGIYNQHSMSTNDSGYFLLELPAPKSGLIKCIGAAPLVRKNTPVIVEGEFDTTFKDIFHSVNVRLNDSSRNDMVKFLKGRSFPGINENKARKIYDTLKFLTSKNGVSHFGELKSADMINCLTSIGIDEQVALTIAVEFTGLEARTKLFTWIKDFGGSYSDAENAYRHFNGEAFKVLEKDPYKGIECGISFKVCDKIAYKKRIDKWDPARIEAILNAIAKNVESSGCCCEKKETVIETANKLQRSSAYSPLSARFLLLAIAASDKFIIAPSSQYGLLVYPKHLYLIEQNIANEIHRLQKNPVKSGYEGFTGTNLDCDQFKATNFLNQSGVYILTGGPGAGKTTTIKTLLLEYKKLYPHDNISLCAPTGRAAVRISESVNMPEYQGQTIHRLIGIKAVGDTFETTYNKENQLPKGLYITDEMSMVDEKIFLEFLQSIPNGSTVILSGDPLQLQSVSAGSVLKDLIASGVIPCVTLTQIHRQGAESLIINNYYHIKNKDEYLEEGNDFIIEKYTDSNRIIDRAIDLYSTYNDAKKPFKFQILTFTKKGLSGRDNLNTLISLKEAPTGAGVFQIGDKVMTTRNNYKTGYFNGDVGIISNISPDGLYIDFYDGQKYITDEGLYDVEHSWACTVHKSQGSEYDTVVVIIDDEYKSMLYSSILLTAITRAKEKVYVLCKDTALNIALTTSKEDERVTGLSEMLIH